MSRSKKILVVCLSLLLVAAIYMAYAWFSNGGVLSTVFQMSRLPSGVSVTLEGEVPGHVYEPGDSLALKYTIDYSTASPANNSVVTRLDFIGDAKVSVYSDENGNPASETVYALKDLNILDMQMDIRSEMGEEQPVGDPADDEWMTPFSMWFRDPVTGIYYNILDPTMKATTNVDVLIKGPETTNLFQGSVVKLDSDYKVVQNNEDALISEMDADWLAILNRMEIVSFDGELISMNNRSRSVNNYQLYKDIIMSMLYD